MRPDEVAPHLATPPTNPDADVALSVLLGLTDLARIHARVLQVQGDVLVLPWPTGVAPGLRAEAERTARPLPTTGRDLTRNGHPHTLIPDGPGVRVARDSVGTALAVLIVDPGSAAVLGHHEHLDLHIGEGVYLLRRQRRYTMPEPDSRSEYVED
jgi:hypothetical protein